MTPGALQAQLEERLTPEFLASRGLGAHADDYSLTYGGIAKDIIAAIWPLIASAVEPQDKAFAVVNAALGPKEPPRTDFLDSVKQLAQVAVSAVGNCETYEVKLEAAEARATGLQKELEEAALWAEQFDVHCEGYVSETMNPHYARVTSGMGALVHRLAKLLPPV